MVEMVELKFRLRGRSSPRVKEAVSLNLCGAAWCYGKNIGPGFDQTGV